MTTETVNDSARAEAEEFTTAMAALWQTQFGPSLLGVYRIGSLAHGGFSRRYSDTDVVIVSERGFTSAELDRARETAMIRSASLGGKLSIFWTDRRFSIGRFPLLDRVDYLDHGVPLIERERLRPDRPHLDEVRAYLGGEPLRRWAEQVNHFASATTLGSAEHKPYLRALLYPARFIFSWMTGQMASNDAAVAYLLDTAPAGVDADLIARALRLRHAARDLDELFPERVKLRGLLAACTRIGEMRKS